MTRPLTRDFWFGVAFGCGVLLGVILGFVWP
jgi:hypothetical protein